MMAPGVESECICTSQELACLERAFQEAFGVPLESEVVASAPGRVNLVGEHTDYNDGFVLPIAIHRRVHAAAGRRAGNVVRVAARDIEDACEFDLDQIAPDPEKRWSNYIRGVVLELQRAQIPVPGADLVVGGNLPIGAGVSSSAALELSVAKALLAISDATLSLGALSRLCRRAETDFVGVGCGIMDQYVCGMGERDMAMLLDCRSLRFQLVPTPLAAGFIVCDTRKARELSESAYNERRAQCEAGARALGVCSLRDATIAQVNQAKDAMEPVVWRRCRHVVTEIERTLQAATCLKGGDLRAFGQLMDRSHQSLRDDYEVSCRELDTMVSAARQAPGCYGARLTGAGFGGCAVALVDAASTEEFVRQTVAAYEAETGIEPNVYPTYASDGASVGPSPGGTYEE